MTRPPGVLVAIPARDEEEAIPVCLAHVLCAATHAQALGHVGRVVVAVSAHRCSDGTRHLAERILAGHDRVEGLVVEDLGSRSVGEARAALVDRARDAAPMVDPRGWWLLNTDADSDVPLTWLTSTLATARATGAVAVAGMVEVRGWQADAATRAAYDRIVQAGIDGWSHGHVYGANLAVRLDAYDDVGGFRGVPHGEDQDLVDRLRSAGLPVATPLTPHVRTSGRVPGRADHGLAALLERLAAEQAQLTVIETDPLSEPA